MKKAITLYRVLCVCVGLAALACLATPAIGQLYVDYTWREVPGDPDQIACFRNSEQHGNYRFSTGFYYLRRPGQSWPIARCPVPPPLNGINGDRRHYSFGVQTSHMARHNRITNGEREITAAEANNLIADNLADDSKAGHVTFISNDAKKVDQFRADWDALCQQNTQARALRSQGYDATQAINKPILAPFNLEKDTGFQSAGLMLLAQAPGDPKDGRSRPATWYAYNGPASLTEAVRSIDPNYDPNKPKFPTIPNLGNVQPEHLAVGGLLGVLGLLTVIRRKPTL